MSKPSHRLALGQSLLLLLVRVCLSKHGVLGVLVVVAHRCLTAAVVAVDITSVGLLCPLWVPQKQLLLALVARQEQQLIVV
jgi:hypothetical protein